MLFEQMERSVVSSRDASESVYDYLNKSARIEMQRVREFLESIFLQYPDDEKKEMISRVRSGNDTHFKSAVFELVLFAFLKKLGCDLQPHPTLPNESSKKPDFLVRTPDGEEFYLEAVLASENTENIDDNDSGLKARKNVFFDSINQLKNENFFLFVSTDDGFFRKPPSTKKLKQKLGDWLEALDPQKIISDFNSIGDHTLPKFEWVHEDWSLVFEAVPKKSHNHQDRIIGGRMLGGGIVDHWTPIKNAVKNKGNRYGANLDKPLIIAVNFCSFILDKIDEMQALFGQEEFVYIEGNASPIMRRMSNGAWGTYNFPKYRRVGAVWLFNDISAFNIPSRRHTIYLNPWSSHTIPDILNLLPHAKLKDGKFEWYDGTSLSQHFNLDVSWPEI